MPDETTPASPGPAAAPADVEMADLTLVIKVQALYRGATGELYALAGSEIHRINPDGTVTLAGMLNTPAPAPAVADAEDDDEERTPEEAEALAEVARIAAQPEPTEEGVMRLRTLLEHQADVVRVRATSAILDIGYGPVEEAEPEDAAP